MKKKLFSLATLLFLGLSVFSQRFAYVDSDYILENIPAYQEAQKELDATSVRWQKQIEEKYEEIDKLYKDYQAEQVLLTEEMKRKREEEIIQKEREAKELQKQKFGVDGALYKKRQELVKPIQEEVFQAIKEIADSGGYGVIFDKAGQSNLLFADEKYDKSDEVLKKLGYSGGSK